MIYLDSCAVIKLLVPEPESRALVEYMQGADDGFGASDLLRVEIHRALIRLESDPTTKAEADELLSGFALLALSPAIVTAAARLPGPWLRSLDALHLATAQELPVSEFVTYDKRLAAAAASLGFAVASPTGSGAALD